jgi:hypothetical protein
MPTPLLAYAEQTDLSGSDWVVVLVYAGTLVLVLGLTLAPIFVAAGRRHPSARSIMAGAILWGLAAAFAGISSAGAELKWSKERLLLVESGYYDPQAKNDAPPLPWRLFGGLALAEGALLAWALAGKRPPEGVTAG